MDNIDNTDDDFNVTPEIEQKYGWQKKPKKIDSMDLDLVWKLATMHCSYKEIALITNVSEPVIRRHLTEFIEKARSIGAKNLRKAQWDKALEGDVKMQVFLGKNYLGQRDQPEDTETNTPLPWNDEEW